MVIEINRRSAKTRSSILLCVFVSLWLIIFCAGLEAKERTIAILSLSDFRGEYAFAYRIKNAAKKLHWSADVLDAKNPAKLKEKKYDFVINLVPEQYEFPNCKNYLALFHPEHHFFNEDGSLKNEYLNYDGYLLSYDPNSLSENDFTTTVKLPYIMWYPTVEFYEYKRVKPSFLFHTGCAWGNRHRLKKFKLFFKLLDNEPFMRFYGLPEFKDQYPNSYKGQIPYDNNSLNKLAAEAGVSLVLHSDEHNQYGVPSGRIFEAAAASTVIISDKNSFVMQNFGDSVLYIDVDNSFKSIFKEVKDHMSWISKNESLAQKKALQSYSIFKERFLLEDQLIQLEKFHEQLSNN